MNEELYNRVSELGISIEHVCEVGVWKPESSNILMFIGDNIRADLIEPDPITVKELKEYFSDFQNVTIHNYAVFDKSGKIELFRKGASTFVGVLPSSPATINDNYTRNEDDSFFADSIPFGELDDGSIDVLSIDTEGCEWFVLMTMKSRPLVISIETHGKKYVNPYMKEIDEWIERNNYSVWYKDKSDTVYYNSSKVHIPKRSLFRRLLELLKKR